MKQMKPRKRKKINASEVLIKLTVEASLSLIPAVGSAFSIMSAIKESIEIEEKGRVDKIASIASKEAKKSQSIVEMMIADRVKKAQKAYVFFTVTLLGQLALAYFSKSELNIWFTVFILFLMVAIYLNQITFENRVKKGLYGTTDYEAREILGFIFSNAEYIDFNDGSGTKRISPEPERETQENIIPEGGVVA